MKKRGEVMSLSGYLAASTYICGGLGLRPKWSQSPRAPHSRRYPVRCQHLLPSMLIQHRPWGETTSILLVFPHLCSCVFSRKNKKVKTTNREVRNSGCHREIMTPKKNVLSHSKKNLCEKWICSTLKQVILTVPQNTVQSKKGVSVNFSRELLNWITSVIIEVSNKNVQN